MSEVLLSAKGLHKTYTLGQRSLEVLRRAAAAGAAATKSGLMLGAGERAEEIAQTVDDLQRAHCQILTLGQYLSPSDQHLPVDRFVEPEEFVRWRQYALDRGFRHVEAGPLVRSSYHAALQVNTDPDAVPSTPAADERLAAAPLPPADAPHQARQRPDASSHQREQPNP